MILPKNRLKCSYRAKHVLWHLTPGYNRELAFSGGYNGLPFNYYEIQKHILLQILRFTFICELLIIERI